LLTSSLKAHESIINESTQNRFVGAFGNYDQFMEENPMIQKLAKFMDLADTFRQTPLEKSSAGRFVIDNMNITVSLFFILAGIFLFMNLDMTTPMMGAILLGIIIVVVVLGFKALRMHSS